jgi:hypothetical protein
MDPVSRTTGFTREEIRTFSVAGWRSHFLFAGIGPRWDGRLSSPPVRSFGPRGNILMPWSTPFEDPIMLPNGKTILTLQQAADYILKMPKAEQNQPAWQAATEPLIMAAEGRGPMVHVPVGMLRGLNRNVEREFNSDRKDTNWGRRKLKRDE